MVRCCRAGYTHLPVDIRQTDDAFLVEASVPGLGPDDVQVTVDGGVLTIAGTATCGARVGLTDPVLASP
ncbi:MAG: Hsp20/alpha crystallin family protein [Candidatus Dormiibacterota bacterium]